MLQSLQFVYRLIISETLYLPTGPDILSGTYLTTIRETYSPHCHQKEVSTTYRDEVYLY